MEIEVHYREEPVGRLHQDSRGGVFFEYAAAWRSGPRELSPLYLPNSTSGAVRTPTPAFGELHGLFQDALPDWWGEQMMRRHFTSLGIPWSRVTALRKLACQGDRKMGALIFHPVLDEQDFNDRLLVDLGALVQSARQEIRGEAGEVLAELVRSGLSPGGARPKALLWAEHENKDLHLDEGPGRIPWLLKFDIDPEFHEGRIEQAYMRMAAAAGIEVPPTRLLEAAGGCHFMARRFDRDDRGLRLHLHSFSGLTHTPVRDGLDYDDLLNLTRELTGDHRAVEQAFRRAVFNVAAGNDDDHGRNHAFLMDDGGQWRLAPAFDLTQASNPLTSGFRAGRVLGKAAGLSRRDLLRLGEAHGVRRIPALLDEVLDALAGWPAQAETVGLPHGTARQIAAQMPGLPLHPAL